eukprot:jgi/Bigna1/91563/estExt_fgenesh1_pg.C_1060044
MFRLIWNSSLILGRIHTNNIRYKESQWCLKLSLDPDSKQKVEAIPVGATRPAILESLFGLFGAECTKNSDGVESERWNSVPDIGSMQDREDIGLKGGKIQYSKFEDYDKAVAAAEFYRKMALTTSWIFWVAFFTMVLVVFLYYDLQDFQVEGAAWYGAAVVTVQKAKCWHTASHVTEEVARFGCTMAMAGGQWGPDQGADGEGQCQKQMGDGTGSCGSKKDVQVQFPPASCHAVSKWEAQETGAGVQGDCNPAVPPAFVSGSCLSIVDDALRNWVDELRKPGAAAASQQDATEKVESAPGEGDSENDPILVVHQPSEQKNKKRRNGGRNTRRSKKGRAARRRGAAAAASRKSESAHDITESEADEHEAAARIKAKCERKLAEANERAAENARVMKQLLARVAAMEAQSTQSTENANEQTVPAPKPGTSKAMVSKAGPPNARGGGKSAPQLIAHNVDGFESGSDDSTNDSPPPQVCHHKKKKCCIGCGRCIKCCCSGGHPQTRQQLRKQVHRKMKRKARKRKRLHKTIAMTMKNKLMKTSERDHAIDAAVREVGDELASSDSSSTDSE